MIESILKILLLTFSKGSEVISGTIFCAAIFLVDILLLIISIAFGCRQVSDPTMNQIYDERVMQLLLLAIIISDFVIIVEAWQGRKMENEIQENLQQLELIFTEQKVKKDVLKLTWWNIKAFTTLFICCSLSTVPVFCDEIFGIWEILLYSLLFMDVTAFRYVISVQLIVVNAKKLREDIEKFIKSEEKSQNATLKFVKNEHKLKGLGEKLVTMTKSYNIISQAVQIVNKRFGMSILCLLFSASLTVTYCGYNFFIEIRTTRSQNVIVGK